MQLPLQQSALVVQAHELGWQLPASTWQVLLCWQVPVESHTLPAVQTLFAQQGSPG